MQILSSVALMQPYFKAIFNFCIAFSLVFYMILVDLFGFVPKFIWIRQLNKCFEIWLYVSYRAENLHAELFLKVIRVLYRSKVSKVCKIKVYEDFLKSVILGFHEGMGTPW